MFPVTECGFRGSEEWKTQNIVHLSIGLGTDVWLEISGDCGTVSLVTCSHMGDERKERKDVKDSESVQKTSLSPAPTKEHMVKVSMVSRAQTRH